jgi:hypothetical protein
MTAGGMHRRADETKTRMSTPVSLSNICHHHHQQNKTPHQGNR